MISLDQILLLEQKVESAVEKISQLQAENDALRSKCAELTNSLSAETERLSAFEQDQSRIENGILKALERLSSIENSVLKTAGKAGAPAQNAEAGTAAGYGVSAETAAPVQETAAEQTAQETPEMPPEPQTAQADARPLSGGQYDGQNPDGTAADTAAEQTPRQPDGMPENGQFDIF